MHVRFGIRKGGVSIERFHGARRSQAAASSCTALAHAPCAACPDNAAERAERTAEGIHARVFICREVSLFFQCSSLLVCGLEEEGRAAVELRGSGKRSGVNFGHLEDGDTEADDNETHDEGYN